MPQFFPTYKKKPWRDGRAPIASFDGAEWVGAEYNTEYKVPWYKGGKLKRDVPSWCDRILYHSLRDLDTLLTPEKVSVDGALAHNYEAVNEVLLCSDHSPITVSRHDIAGIWVAFLLHSSKTASNLVADRPASTSAPPVPRRRRVWARRYTTSGCST